MDATWKTFRQLQLGPLHHDHVFGDRRGIVSARLKNHHEVLNNTEIAFLKILVAYVAHYPKI